MPDDSYCPTLSGKVDGAHESGLATCDDEHNQGGN